MRTPKLTPRLRDERGFTLIELLVAMLSTTVIMIAMIGLLVFTTNQASRITERVQADRIGRLAMTRITDELHSSCTGFNTDAIQGPSSTVTSPLEPTGALNLWFISAYGSPTSEKAVESTVYEHDIRWESKGTNSSGEKLGNLWDYRFESKSGSGPSSASGKWEFPELKEASAKPILLAKNVTPMSVSGTSTIFQYYTLSHETGAYKLLTENISTAATANTIAKVTISFKQAPEGGETKLGRAVPFNDAVVLRLNPTETGTATKDEPCS
jgi:type II secretory pathway pseudopilin PulG